MRQVLQSLGRCATHTVLSHAPASSLTVRLRSSCAKSQATTEAASSLLSGPHTLALGALIGAATVSVQLAVPFPSSLRTTSALCFRAALSCLLPRPPLRTQEDFGLGLGRPSTSCARSPTRTAGRSLMLVRDHRHRALRLDAVEGVRWQTDLRAAASGVRHIYICDESILPGT